MTFRAVVTLAVSLLAAAALPATAGSDSNWVDPALGGQPVTIDMGPGSEYAADLAVQPDGKVVVVGAANSANEGGRNSDMAVVRFHPDGRLDTTFGEGGRAFIDNQGGREFAYAVTLQSDGKVVVVGIADVWNGYQETGTVAVARLDALGRPDPTFNGGRMMVLRNRYLSSGALGATVQPDGKILVVGGASLYDDPTTRVSDVLIFRLGADGTIDESFGDAGFVLTDMEGWETYDGASFVTVRPDGRILAAGGSSQPSRDTPISHQILLQYSPSGALDPTFGNGGMVINPATHPMSAVALRSDGTLVAAGEASMPPMCCAPRSTWPSRSVGVTAYRADGTVDTGFGPGGMTVTHAPPATRGSDTKVNGTSYALRIAVDGRGRLIVAGSAFVYDSVDLAVLRYNGAGALDTSFGRAGWVTTDVSDGHDHVAAVGVLPDGGIVAAGTTSKDGSSQIVFAVYPSSDEPASASAWGWNPVGELGNGTTVDQHAPTPVSSLTGGAALAGGPVHSLAVDDTGRVHAWGWNGVGQLGDATTTDRRRPVSVPGLTGVASVAAGYFHSLAVQGGVVKAWGWNPLGQVGDGTTVDRHQPVSVAGLNKVSAVAAGAYHSLALRSDGSVWAWGWNGAGQLGNGSTVDSHQPVHVPGLTDIVAVAAGAYHSLALSTDGVVWAWGWNAVNQLGDGSTVDRHRPVQVTGPGVIALAAGGFHNLALKSDGSVLGWGYNGFGEIGDGTLVNRAIPVRVGLPETNAVAAGGLHSVAITADERVRAWGWNGVGQLGDGTTVDRRYPVLTGGPLPVEAIAAGAYHNLALGLSP